MNSDQITNDLLTTFEGIEYIALISWFADYQDTASFYNVSLRDAKELHSLAYYKYINDII